MAFLIVFLFTLAVSPLSSAESKGGQTTELSEYEPDAILVKFKAGVTQSQIQSVNSKHNGKVEKSLDKIGVHKVRFPKGVNVEEKIKQYGEDPRVEYAEPNYERKVFVTPNDSYYASHQWNMPKMRAPEAWDVEQGSSNVIIAIVDTGVSLNHPDLDGKLVAGYDYYGDPPFYAPDSDPSDENGHGTYVAGIAAAETNNSQGVAGVSWHSRIMPIRVLGPDGSGWDSDIANGVIWAADHGAKIINMSLGGSDSSQTLIDAVNYAYNLGCVLVAASGNSNTNQPFYPAAYDHVIAVGATNSSDQRASFSNYGSYLDVTAPGEGITSTYFYAGLGIDTYATGSGTSAASPHVAGLAALLASHYPGWTNDQIEQRIKNSADDLGSSGWDQYYGYGRINLEKSLRSAVWFIKHSGVSGFGATTNASVEWGNLSGDYPLVGDFSGDGRDDLMIHRAASHPNWFVRLATISGFDSDTSWSLSWGNVDGDTSVVGDFDGDGKDDIAIYRYGSYPNWFFKLSTGTGFAAGTFSLSWGNPGGDTPLVGDFNGDGMDDIAIYRYGSNPNWFVRIATGSPGNISWGETWSLSWGNPGGDTPIVGNFNGDVSVQGHPIDDIGIYRTGSYPNWFFRVSQGGDMRNGPTWSTSWGNAGGETPLVGDFNGGGIEDIGIWRTTSYPNWFANFFSGSGFDSGTDSSISWGNITKETPLVGDFNADGRKDIGIFRLP